MTAQSAAPSGIDYSQFDSESEDYDALPAGSTAILITSAVLALPVMALSLALIPVTAATQSIAALARRSVRQRG